MIFVPSRNRRASLQRFFDFGQPTFPGRVLIDDDDDSYEGMKLPEGWEFFVNSRRSTGALLNLAYRTWPDEQFYAQIGDDYVCRPLGWDVALSESCGWNKISWGNDGRWGEKLCTSFFVGGEIVRLFDWFAHPMLEHLYVDTVWWMVAKGSGLARYRADIETKHINVKDKTYSERRIIKDHSTFNKLRGDAIDELINLAAEYNK